MAVQASGTQIRIPQGDTGNVKFAADGALSDSDRALFTLARRDGGVILRKVLPPDLVGNAFHMAFVYEDTSKLRPDNYEWSLRVVRGGVLDSSGKLTDAQGSHTPILRGTLTIQSVAGGAR